MNHAKVPINPCPNGVLQSFNRKLEHCVDGDGSENATFKMNSGVF